MLSLIQKNILFRYVSAGLCAASTNIILLFVFTHYFKIWYIISSILSFVVAVIISFTLQKFWTFGNNEMEKVHQQFSLFVIGALIGLCINSVFMYTLVEYFVIWYIVAQIITSAFIAVLNFFMYKFIFKRAQTTFHE